MFAYGEQWQNHLAVAQKAVTQNGLPWEVETWTKTCGLPQLNFEPQNHLGGDVVDGQLTLDTPSDVLQRCRSLLGKNGGCVDLQGGRLIQMGQGRSKGASEQRHTNAAYAKHRLSIQRWLAPIT